MHLLYLESECSPKFHFPGLHRKGPEMEARQEVRLKEAEAADQRSTANRDTFAEPTESIIGKRGQNARSNPAKNSWPSDKLPSIDAEIENEPYSGKQGAGSKNLYSPFSAPCSLLLTPCFERGA